VMGRVVAINAAVLSLLCGAILWSDGFGLYGFDAQYRADIKRLSPAPAAYTYPYVCQRARLSEADLQNKACIINAKQEPSVLLWGDSHAGHYVGMLGSFAEAGGFAFRNAAHSGCPPLLRGAAATQNSKALETCLASIEEARRHLREYSVVILGAAWNTYEGRSDSFFEDVDATVDALVKQGKQVIILAQVPSFPGVNRKCPQRALKLPMLKCDEGGSAHPAVAIINTGLAALAAARTNVHFFDPHEQLCPGGQCSSYLDGKLMYFDASHLSMEGSRAIGRKIVRETGVPAEFAWLGGRAAVPVEVPQPIPIAWQGRFNAISAISADGWRPLITVSGGRNWRGNAQLEERAEGARLTDASTEAFSVSRYRFPASTLNELQKLRNGAPVRLQLTLASCVEALPMLRLRVWHGDLRSQYDVMLDCASTHRARRGTTGTIKTRVERVDGQLRLEAEYAVPREIDKLEISLYPAVGKKLGRYDATATGTVTVRDIAWAVAPFED
jgi:hypothetical protein